MKESTFIEKAAKTMIDQSYSKEYMVLYMIGLKGYDELNDNARKIYIEIYDKIRLSATIIFGDKSAEEIADITQKAINRTVELRKTDNK